VNVSEGRSHIEALYLQSEGPDQHIYELNHEATRVCAIWKLVRTNDPRRSENSFFLALRDSSEPYERVQTAFFCSRDTPYDHRGK
jgi:hypothetical protein